MKAIEFEKVTRSDIKTLRVFFRTFSAYDKYCVLNAVYLTHPIHMQLSQKQKTLSQFFCTIFQC